MREDARAPARCERQQREVGADARTRGWAGVNRLLIVNADDFGLTAASARGILRAHREGIVTSVSVLALGPAVGRTAPWLRDEGGLGVGAHLAVVGEDPPLLSRREIPTLVGRSGRLPLTWSAFLARAVAGRVDPLDVEREFQAQLERLTRDFGLALTHVDTHQHVHLWPPIGRVTVALARRFRIPGVRLPSSRAPGPKGYGIRRLSRALATRIRSSGLATPDGYAGLDEAGALDLPRFLATIDTVACGSARTVEINCHPGEEGDADLARYAWDYRWGAELAALTSPELRDAVARHGFTLGGYRDLPAPARP